MKYLPSAYQHPINSYRGRSWLGVGRVLVTGLQLVIVMVVKGRFCPVFTLILTKKGKVKGRKVPRRRRW